MKNIASILIFLILLTYSCTQKEETMTASPEAQEINIQLPQTHWDKSISILKESEDTMTSYLDPAIDNELFNHLSHFSNLMVQNNKSEKSDYQLKRSIHKEEDEWIVQIQIEETSTGEMVYEKKIQNEDPFYISDIIINDTTLSQKMGITLPEESIEPDRPVNKELQLKYMKALSLLEEESYDCTNEAVGIFKEILRQDPKFAKAAVGLVHSYQQVIHNGWNINVAFIQLAQDAALKAIEIEPFSAESHEALAQVYQLRHKMKDAEKSFLKAIELNSNLSNSWKGLGNIYSHYGLYEAAQEAFQKNLMLDPFNQDVILSNALINIGLGNYSEARNEMKRLLKSYPHSDYVYIFIALTQFYENNLVSAKESLTKGLNSKEYSTLAHAVQAMILAKEGHLDKALGEVELEVKPYVNSDASLCVAVAAIYALIGQKGNVIQWLQKAIDWEYHEYVWIKNDPNFESMKGDARFNSILNQLYDRWQEKRLSYLTD